MMHDLLQSPWVAVVGLALVHFVWQGALVHVALGVVLQIVPAGRPSVRYALACVALVVMFVAPIVTVVRLAPPPVATAAVAAFSDATTSDGAAIAGANPGTAARGSDVQTASVPTGSPGGQMSMRPGLAVWLAPQLPMLVVAWLVGVALLLVWLAGRLALAHSWRTRHVAPVSAEIAQVATAVAARVGVRHAIKVLMSVRAAVPMVVGIVRPVVLLPASAVMGLSARQLEVLLAHEFVHVKRLDPLMNMFQNVVEAVLFYHPSVWMVSRRVRREREFCCDEVAMATGGDRLLYAGTLRDFAVLQRSRAAVGVAATGGRLPERIRRIVVGPMASPTNGFAVALSVLSVMLLIGLASALGSGEPLKRVLLGVETVHGLTADQVLGLLDEAPSLPLPERVSLLEALAPVAVNPPHAAVAFQWAVATLPGDALEEAHPALKWPPYPGVDDGTWVWLTAVGSVRLTDDYRDVVAVHPEGWLRIEARHADGVHLLVAESASDGAPVPIYGADRRIGVGRCAHRLLRRRRSGSLGRRRSRLARAHAEPEPGVGRTPPGSRARDHRGWWHVQHG
jgi:beta-lactamase regulating signal transducer with metallopeptidase domain